MRVEMCRPGLDSVKMFSCCSSFSIQHQMERMPRWRKKYTTRKKKNLYHVSALKYLFRAVNYQSNPHLPCLLFLNSVTFTKRSSQRRLKKWLFLHLWLKLLHVSRTALVLLFSTDKFKLLEQICSQTFSKHQKTPNPTYTFTEICTIIRISNSFKGFNYTVRKQIDPCPWNVSQRDKF